MSKNEMIGKSTFLLFVILAFAMLFMPLTSHHGSMITSLFPEAFGQLPVLNVTSSTDAPCAATEAEVTPTKPLCSCYELGTCDVFSAPLDTMLEPFFCAFTFGSEDAVGEDGTCATGSGQVFLIVIWGIIIGVIWLRTSSTMITGVVGIGIATIFTFNEKTLLVGIVLLGAAIGIVVYQLYKQRLDFPTN